MLTDRDNFRLKGVHPDLVRVVTRAIKFVDFMVLEGLRTKELQAVYVAKGASQTMFSRHITGHAVDLVPLINGQISWAWPSYFPMAKVIKEAAETENVKIVWGGDWVSFKDGPHFELDRKFYPGA